MQSYYHEKSQKIKIKIHYIKNVSTVRSEMSHIQSCYHEKITKKKKFTISNFDKDELIIIITLKIMHHIYMGE